MTFANIKPVLIGLGLAALIGGLVYVKGYLPKVTYGSVVPKEGKLVESISGVGTLEAKEMILLAPKSTAKIGSIFADEGEHVRKGAVLARMELSELAGNKAESIAVIEKSRSQMAVQKGVIDDLQAKKELADATLERYRTLFKGGYVTQAELESVQASSRSAHALVLSAKEALVQSQHEIERAQGSLSALDAKIGDLELRSPIDGVVVSRDAEAGSTVTAGSAVFRIADPNTVWVKIYIDERQSSALSLGQKAKVTLRSFPNKIWDGTVRRIGVQSDRVTEERIVYIALEKNPYPLHLGEQAEAEICVAIHPGSLILPATGIVQREGKPGVWLAEGGKAFFHPVKVIGRNRQGEVAVSGLKKESRVILAGERPLQTGDKVRL